MFFCIIGNKHQNIVSHALEYFHPREITTIKNNIVLFKTDFPDRIPQCGAVIKRGVVCDRDTLLAQIQDTTILGVPDKKLGALLKNKVESVRRYKIIEDIIHSDRDIKEKGKEIVDIDGKQRGLVQGHQNISLYENIDFEKPVGGMKIGMMPSKLAHQLINIAVGAHEEYNTDIKTIRDPFCGFGTTNFLVNSMNYNTMASDIKASSVKQNQKRRMQTSFSKEKKFLTKKQDVTQAFGKIFAHADCIVSEGWLGYIITNATWPKEAYNSSQKVLQVYISFLENLTTLFKESKKTKTLVITIPVWIKHNHNFSISKQVQKTATELGREGKLLEYYSRPKQLVARQIFIAHFNTTTTGETE